MAEQALATTSQIPQTKQIDAEALSKVILEGDLSKLSPAEKVSYYNRTCDSLGLNPYTKPLSYMKIDRWNSQNHLKETVEILYFNRDGSDQLRKINKISLKIMAREKIGDCYVVTARASMPDGREDESTGVVSLSTKNGLAKGDFLANLYMKAETKAKRRVTLSICGLGWMDESEVDTVPGAQRVPVDSDHRPVATISEANSPGEPPHEIDADDENSTPPLDRIFQNDENDFAKISDPQCKRLFAIAYGKGWKNPQIQRLLKKYGYVASRDVLLRDYDEIVEQFSKQKASEYNEDTFTQNEEEEGLEWPKEK